MIFGRDLSWILEDDFLQFCRLDQISYIETDPIHHTDEGDCWPAEEGERIDYWSVFVGCPGKGRECVGDFERQIDAHVFHTDLKKAVDYARGVVDDPELELQ